MWSVTGQTDGPSGERKGETETSDTSYYHFICATRQRHEVTIWKTTSPATHTTSLSVSSQWIKIIIVFSLYVNEFGVLCYKHLPRWSVCEQLAECWPAPGVSVFGQWSGAVTSLWRSCEWKHYYPAGLNSCFEASPQTSYRKHCYLTGVSNFKSS